MPNAEQERREGIYEHYRRLRSHRRRQRTTVRAPLDAQVYNTGLRYTDVLFAFVCFAQFVELCVCVYEDHELLGIGVWVHGGLDVRYTAAMVLSK